MFFDPRKYDSRRGRMKFNISCTIRRRHQPDKRTSIRGLPRHHQVLLKLRKGIGAVTISITRNRRVRAVGELLETSSASACAHGTRH